MIDYMSFAMIGQYFKIVIKESRPVKTNFFLLIPGESSATGKTSTFDILKEIFTDLIQSSFSSTNGTWEFLESHPEVIYVADEFTKVLKDIVEGKHGASGLDELFCTLYDSPKKIEPPNYISQKRKALVDIKVSCIGLTTPRHFDNINTDNLMTGGFFNRFLFYRARIEDNAWDKPSLTPLQQLAYETETQLLTKAVNSIRDIVNFEIEIDDSFKDRVKKQLKMVFDDCKSKKDFSFFGYMRRMQAYMYKIASILVIDEWIKNNYDILNPTIITGLKQTVKLVLSDKTIVFKNVLNYIYPSFSEFTKTNSIMSGDKNLMKIHRYIAENEDNMPIPIRDVYRFNHMRKKDFVEIINSIDYLHDYIVFHKDRSEYICQESINCSNCAPDIEIHCQEAKQARKSQSTQSLSTP